MGKKSSEKKARLQGIPASPKKTELMVQPNPPGPKFVNRLQRATIWLGRNHAGEGHSGFHLEFEAEGDQVDVIMPSLEETIRTHINLKRHGAISA